MIPLNDASRRPMRFPVATATIIVLNVIVFIMELIGGDSFVMRWALIPADIVAGKHLETILTSMFMHGGWEHIIGNMVFFWAFGPEVEDAMGSGRFTIFYLLGGVAATFAQVIVDPTSTVPNLGASGAIAAVMGAFLVTYPRDQIRTLVIIGWFVNVTFIPAVVLIGVWALTQLASGVGALATVQSNGGVAYMAHVGGFTYGLLTARLFERGGRAREEGHPFPQENWSRAWWG